MCVVVGGEYASVFRQVYPRLVALGVLKSSSRDVASELAQETMLRAYQRWDDVSQLDAPASWCRTVMVRLLIDHHRSSRSERVAIERLAAAPRHDVGDAVGSAVSRWESMVAPLSARQRMIVTLYYADDLSTSQIADLLGIGRNAVKASLFKARRSIRRVVDAEHEGGFLDG